MSNRHHHPSNSFVCLSSTTKSDNLYIYIYIYIYSLWESARPINSAELKLTQVIKVIRLVTRRLIKNPNETCLFKYGKRKIVSFYNPKVCPVGWGSRIHRLHLCRGVWPHPNECPDYDVKQSDGEVPVMPGLWGIQSTPSLPLLPGPQWSGVVASDKALSMG